MRKMRAIQVRERDQCCTLLRFRAVKRCLQSPLSLSNCHNAAKDAAARSIHRSSSSTGPSCAAAHSNTRSFTGIDFASHWHRPVSLKPHKGSQRDLVKGHGRGQNARLSFARALLWFPNRTRQKRRPRLPSAKNVARLTITSTSAAAATATAASHSHRRRRPRLRLRLRLRRCRWQYRSKSRVT